MKYVCLLIMVCLNFQNLVAQSWSEATIIIDNMSEFPGFSSLSIDKNLNKYLIWSNLLDPKTLFFTMTSINNWLAPRSIITYQGMENSLTFPQITVDIEGTPYIIWSENTQFPEDKENNYSLFHSRFLNGAWTVPLRIFSSESLHSGVYCHQMGVDDSLVYLYWKIKGPGGTLWLQSGNSSHWTSPVRPFPEWTTPNGHIEYPHLYAGNDDTLHFVFAGSPPDTFLGGGRLLEVYYSYKSRNDAAWREPVEVYRNPNTQCHEPKIVVDRQGIRHIIWLEDVNGNVAFKYLYYSYSYDGRSWSKPSLISQIGGFIVLPQLFLDSQNKLHIIWTQVVFGESHHAYYSYGRFDTWSLPQEIPQQLNGLLCSAITAVAIDSKDFLHIVWEEEYGADEKKYRFCHSSIEATTVAVSNDTKTGDSKTFTLQNYPNPFNSTTTICYTLPRSAHVSLKIYNLSGQEINTLIDKAQNAGGYRVLWQGTDNLNIPVASGLYLYQLNTDGVVQTKKMIFMR